jgi:hypothetical protein
MLFLRVAGLSHLPSSGATAATDGKLADSVLCPSLPLNARCDEIAAGLNIRVTGFLRDGLFSLSAN